MTTSDEFLDQYQPQQTISADNFLNQYQPQTEPTVSTTKDVAKSAGSNLATGALSLPLAFGNLGNSLVAGPQWLGRGVAEGVDQMIGVQSQPRGDLWQPFYDASMATKDLGIDYQPKTAWGAAVAIPAQVVGSLGSAKIAPPIMAGISKVMSDEGSGMPINVALGGIPSAYEKLSPSLQNSDDIKTTMDSLKTTKNTGYENAKTLGAIYTPAASDHIGIIVPAQVESKLGYKLDPKLHPQTIAMLNNLQNKSEVGLTTNDLENVRIGLNKVISGSPSTPDAYAANLAKQSIDGISAQTEQNPRMLVGGNAQAVQAFKDARGANSIAQRYSDIANIVTDARNNPGKIQSSLQKLVSSKNENDFNRYTPDEQEAIQEIAYPNGVDTKLQGGGLGSKVLHAGGIVGKALAGSVVGAESGHPLIGATIGAGQGAYTALKDTLQGNSILKGADNLLNIIAMKSTPIKPITPSNPQAAFLRQIPPSVGSVSP